MKNDKWLKKFEKEVLPKIKRHYKPLKIILFGSRVHGKSTEDSDIDVIIVSDKFSEIRFVNRMYDILKKIRFPKHVDYICYTPEEFKDIVHSSIVIKDAVENGVEVPL